MSDAADTAPAEIRSAGDAPKKRKPRVTAKALHAALELRLGHTFRTQSLLVHALTHVSALKSGKSRTETYQRLEFLGDHVLGLVVSDMLYRAFPKASEGELSKRLADLVRKESCADVARALDILDAVKVGGVAGPAAARLRASIAGDICEAVIGAIYLDGGHAAASDFIARNWTERMKTPARPLRDPKTVLQEWAQGRGLPAPTYREVERTGPHHNPMFRVAVDAPGLESAEGTGPNKRAAEQAAAAAMIAREDAVAPGKKLP
jgi:ribonuclease-3